MNNFIKVYLIIKNNDMDSRSQGSRRSSHNMILIAVRTTRRVKHPGFDAFRMKKMSTI
jgi:hypothetical protein